MEDFEIILLVKNWPINWPIKLYKGNMGKKKTKAIQDLLREANEKHKPKIIQFT